MDQLLYSNKTTNIIAETQFEYGSITNRLTAIPEIVGSTGFFTDMALNDVYESDDIIINQLGVYSLYFYAQTNVWGGTTTVSYVYGDEIFGGANNPAPASTTFEFFALAGVLTIGKLKDIVIKNPTKIRMQFTVTGKNILSIGYRVTAGKILLVKNK